MKMNANSTLPDGKRAFTAESLPDHPLFRGLSERHRQILAECSMPASFTAGESVVETGEPANCFYLVITGSIGLETLGSRAPMRVQTIGPGDILGWSWLFPPYYWHFNAIADEATEAIFFYGSRLRQECDRDHDFGYELFKRMSQILVVRLQATRVKWIEAAQFNPPRHGIPPDYLII
jgi:CRP-like cAMP-binding protein